MSILTSPKTFQNSFLGETSNGKIDDEYGAVIRVILYYLWRGCSLSQEAGKKGLCDPKASLITLSAYEAVLGILQSLRHGYQADTAVLLRALMERVAIVGYLAENRQLIGQYFLGKSYYKKALDWAKKNALENWMHLYSLLCKVVHSDREGPAGHINNLTEIGLAFRLSTEKYADGSSMTDVLVGLIVYSLIALDPLAFRLIQNDTTRPFTNDPNFIIHVGETDAKAFLDFLKQFALQYNNPRN